MDFLWKILDARALKKEQRGRLFLEMNTMLFGILGFLMWIMVRNFVFHTIDWAFCFVGYSGFLIGFVGGYMYLCRKE